MSTPMHSITIYEDAEKLAIEAIQEKEAIKDLDEYMSLLWKITPFEFEAAIKFMETCLKFNCSETPELIRRDLRKSHPYTWAAYATSKLSDNT